MGNFLINLTNGTYWNTFRGGLAPMPDSEPTGVTYFIIIFVLFYILIFIFQK